MSTLRHDPPEQVAAFGSYAPVRSTVPGPAVISSVFSRENVEKKRYENYFRMQEIWVCRPCSYLTDLKMQHLQIGGHDFSHLWNTHT